MKSVRKLARKIAQRFKRKPKPIVLTKVSEAWIKSHLYNSGKDRNNS